LLELDSSISGRMAWRSSLAEITGNNKKTVHTSETRHCIERRCRLRIASRCRRHMQKAGRNSKSQQKLRKGSIFKTMQVAACSQLLNSSHKFVSNP